MALLRALRLPCLLLLADVLALAALARLAPALVPWGPVATWLEAAWRLAVLGITARLLAPGGPRGAAAVVFSLAPAVFLTLRNLLVPAGTTPLLLATAPPAWLAASRGAAVAALLLLSATPTPTRGHEGAGTTSLLALRRLLALVFSEWLVLGTAVVFLVLAMGGEALETYCTSEALGAIRQGNGPTAFTITLVAITDLARTVFTGCRGYFFMLAEAQLKCSTCDRLLSRLVRQDLAFFKGKSAAMLSSRLAKDVPELCEALALNANVALRSLGMALGFGGFMVMLSPRLALLALLEVPLTIVAQKIYDTRQEVLQRAMLDASAKASAVVQEAVSAIETVRAFAGEEEEEQHHSRAVDETLRLKARMEVEQAVFTLVMKALRLGVQVLVLCYGRRQLREGSIGASSLIAFLFYQEKVGKHVQALVFGQGGLLSKVAASHETFEYLDQEPTGDIGGTWAPATLQGHVTFQRVSFAYPARPDRLILRDVTFTLRPGEVTALAGHNGSGKSTCAGLLQRLYEPERGEVLLDAEPLRRYEHRYLHRQVVGVGQEPVLLAGSIRDNIVFGLEGCGDDEVRAAAAAAGALGFISALEQGFDTDVGVKGAQLSAGEKQLVAIARALLRRPAVLILDEATSALDGQREVGPQQWVRSGLARTVLLITHCPRRLEEADRVVVLQRGTVAETGTPAQLRSRRGPYSHLVRHSTGTGQRETPGTGCGGGQPAPSPPRGQEEGAAPVGMGVRTK